MSSLNTIIYNLLPDNRPITALKIIEDHGKCPKNYVAVTRTYDQDGDADLWRETGIFSKRQARYLCLSKSEGSSDHFVETVKIIGEKETPPLGFCTLQKTADTETRAWRKKQIVYKLGHRESVQEVVTDVLLCSKSKNAPQDYISAGDINGILLFYRKTRLGDALAKGVDLITMGFGNINKSVNGGGGGRVLYPGLNGQNNDSLAQQPEYENLKSNSPAGPIRPAPRPPAPLPPSQQPQQQQQRSIYNTLGHNYSELDGVPFQLAVQLRKSDVYSFPENLFSTDTNHLGYDFELERQVLCTTKAIASTNPFFK